MKESVQSDEITLRTFQNMQLEQQIHEHVKKMKLFNQNKSALNAKEALKQAEDNLNEVFHNFCCLKKLNCQSVIAPFLCYFTSNILCNLLFIIYYVIFLSLT